MRGTLRITGPTVFGGRHLTPVVADFLAEHSGVQADLTLHDRNLDLIEGELHVALRIGPWRIQRLVVRKVGEVRRFVVAAPDYLAQRGTPLEPGDLADHDLILTTVVSASPEWRFEHRGKPRAVRLEPRLRVNNVEAALEAMLSGRGIGRALSYQVARDLAAGRLVRLLRRLRAPAPAGAAGHGGRPVHAAPGAGVPGLRGTEAGAAGGVAGIIQKSAHPGESREPKLSYRKAPGQIDPQRNPPRTRLGPDFRRDERRI